MGIVGTQKSNNGMKQQSIEQLEHDIEITLAFLSGDLTMKQWTYYINKYNALSIKLCQMKGERPMESYSNPNYII